MNRRGMTLVEMLVAMTATLILMAAVTQVFAVFGRAISASRSLLDSDSKLRLVAWKLRRDLENITAQPLPPRNPESSEGYLEIIEGPLSDLASVTGTIGPADCDDVLMFTTRAKGEPFLGRSSAAGSIQSTAAEVAWFARQGPAVGGVIPTYTLYRRQLLVAGYIDTGTFTALSRSGTSAWSTFYATNDISVRKAGGFFYPNSLSDLTRRECRFMHNPTGTSAFPFEFVPSHTTAVQDGLVFDAAGGRQGEDIVLTNVLAFDVRVFDPGLPLDGSPSGNLALSPSDSGYSAASPIGYGGYVDLGQSPTMSPPIAGVWPHFSGPGQLRSGLTTSACVYDTWSTHYEAGGPGTNGRDDDSDGKIDEPPYDINGDGDYTDAGEDDGELLRSPPYPFPLRGIEVRIRCLDEDSRQVRQITVRHTFVPH